MPPRIARSFLKPIQSNCNGFLQMCAPFSTSSRVCADDPTTGLMDMLSPAKTSRRSNLLSPSRPSSRPADSSNPSLFGIPRSTAESSDSGSPSRLMETLKRALPTSTPSNRHGALQRNDSRRATEPERMRTKAVEQQATRNWRDGDVYAPHDLSPVEMQKARKARVAARSNNMAPANTRKKGGKDVLDDLNINPLLEYKNFAMMSEFVTEMGRIRHSRDTGLRPVNQRKMAKAVRRAIGIGIMPSVHRHPELMDERLQMRNQKKPRS